MSERWSRENLDLVGGVPWKMEENKVGDGEEMCGQLVYYHPFVAREGRRGPGPGPGPGGVAGLARPEPGDEPNERDRDNDLYNVLFNVTEGLAS